MDGRKLHLIIEDGTCDPKEATTVGKKLIEIDRVSYIIGGICSGETLAIAPIAQQSKVILFSPGSSNPSITQSGDYIFRNYPSDAYQGVFAADYLFKTLGKQLIAVIAANQDYTQGIKKEFEKALKNFGGSIVLSIDIDPEEKDFNTILTKVKNTNPDAVYASTLVGQGVRLMKAAKQIGITVPIFGLESWDDQQTLLADPTAVGGNYYAVISAPAAPDHLKVGIKKFCSTCDIAPGVLQSYDAVHILAKALEKGGFKPEKVKDALYRTSYEGVSGHIEFDQNGDLKEASYAVKKIENGKSIHIFP